MKAAVQVLKQAEDLKDKVSGDILSDNETWTSHQKLKDLYQQLLVTDLEFALDKKVEQDLWNFVFKNQISVLQSQAKDKKNPRRTELQGHLTWFLDIASGFYLQLLQELCDTFELDLPCRRKGSVYGIIKEPNPNNDNITSPQKSSCLYVCQHCLVHLGDIARYRSQSLQAESFYHHAAQLVPSNGQPYNQLAILEAAKGEKLSTVFYYVRSIAVKYPFPAASTNLQKMFAKIAADEICIEGKAKLSVYDYISAFLQFHSLVHMISDLEKADKLLKVLSSNLTTLVATESLSSWKLVQMTSINLFALAHLKHGFDCPPLEKRNKKFDYLSEEESKSYLYMLELLDMPHEILQLQLAARQECPIHNVGEKRETSDKAMCYAFPLELLYRYLLTTSMLNGLLLLVYTMKDEENFMDYYALPIIKLILDWIRQDVDVLTTQPFLQKLQIWPSLCKLLNGLQQGISEDFDCNKYNDLPLPEDWDLQCFVPLAKSNKQYKFKENNIRLLEEEEAVLRAYRLVKHGQWICDQEIAGKKLMKMLSAGKSGKLTFEAIIQKSPSSDFLLQLEEVSGSKIRNNHLEVQLESYNNNIVIQESLQNQDMKFEINSNLEDLSIIDADGNEFDGKIVIRENGEIKLENKLIKMNDNKINEKMENCGMGGKENHPGGYLREKKSRQNVAMQTIMQKKNPSSKNETSEDAFNSKPKLETKQVTFKTPSPSPPASSEGTPPLVIAQPSSVNSMDGMNFSALQAVHPQIQQQPSYGSFTSVQPSKASFNNQSLVTGNKALLNTGAYPSNRIVQSNLSASSPSYQQMFKLQNQHPGNDYSALSSFSFPLKEAATLTQAGGNRLNTVSGNVLPSVHQRPFLYNVATSSNPTINPNQSKQSFMFGDNHMFGQPIQWYSPTPIPNPSGGVHSLPSLKPNNLQVEQLITQNQPRPSQVSSSQMEGSSHTVSSHPPTHPQPLSPGTYQIFTSPQPAAHLSPQQNANNIAENIVFQMPPSPLIQYNFQSSIQSHLPPNSTSLHLANASQTKMGLDHSMPMTSSKLPATNHLDVEKLSVATEAITNTYSLFNSPWSSGLNLSPSPGKERIRLPTSSVPPPPPTNFGNFLQPGVQSFWSGPGPSPLERLLEQQKQKHDAAPQ